jgi:hypothetical protein
LNYIRDEVVGSVGTMPRSCQAFRHQVMPDAKYAFPFCMVRVFVRHLVP